MSKWVMRAHFRHLHSKSFPIPQAIEFWPLQSLFEVLEVHRDSISQNGSCLGSVRVHSLILPHTFLRSQEYVMLLPSFFLPWLPGFLLLWLSTFLLLWLSSFLLLWLPSFFLPWLPGFLLLWLSSFLLLWLPSFFLAHTLVTSLPWLSGFLLVHNLVTPFALVVSPKLGLQ